VNSLSARSGKQRPTQEALFLSGGERGSFSGGADKCRHFRTRLGGACPDGIDVYFENVGGAVLDAVLPLLNRHARIPCAGSSTITTRTAPPPGRTGAPP